MIKFAQPQIGEEEKQAVLKVLSGDRLSDGPMAEQFEAAFEKMHGGHAVAVSSATAGLHLLFMARRVTHLIIPALTHVATAHAAIAAGAQIRFADCGADGNINAETVAAVKTGDFADAKVCAMHFLGKQCNIDADFADSALRIGQSVSCPSVYSFHPAKYMTTGEGGMILVDDEALAIRLRNLRAFGRDKSGSYTITEFGLNYRMTEMQAAIGIEQLKKLPDWLQIRKLNWLALSLAMPVEISAVNADSGSHYAYCAMLPKDRDRDALRAHLLQAGIETSVYYPIPVPLQPFYGAQHIGNFPGAETISNHSLCYPVGPHIGELEIRKMAKETRKWLDRG